MLIFSNRKFSTNKCIKKYTEYENLTDTWAYTNNNKICFVRKGTDEKLEEVLVDKKCSYYSCNCTIPATFDDVLNQLNDFDIKREKENVFRLFIDDEPTNLLIEIKLFDEEKQND